MPLTGSNPYFSFYGSAGGEPEYIGATMLFQQSNAPTGWTKDTTTVNDYTLRVVSGSGGGLAGVTGFSSIYASRGLPSTAPAVSVSLGPTVIDATTIASHSHTYTDALFTSSFFAPPLAAPLPPYPATAGSNTFGRYGVPTTGALNSIYPTPIASGAHTHPAGPFPGTLNAPVNINVQYVDFIVATKD